MDKQSLFVHFMDIFITIYVQSVFIGMYEIRFKSLLNKMKDDIPEMNRIILFTRGLIPEVYSLAVLGDQSTLKWK